MKRAIILSIGDELVSGAIVDTNSAWLSVRLMELGYAVGRHVTVGDERSAIRGELLATAAAADAVVVTGGLGPTLDDVSRHGLADALGVELVEDARSLERIAAYFAARGREMRPSNRVQALCPRGAELLDNECGTAPGLLARLGRAQVFILPGVPHEMREMFERQAAPLLAGAGAIARRVLHTCGLGESNIGERLADLMARGRNPSVGTTACAGVISVRILAAPADDSPQAAAAAERAADADAAEVRRRLADIIFGEGDQTLSVAVGQLLRRRGQTLAVAESCTGGMLGQMITAVPGSSDYFLGGLVVYANAAKIELAGVDRGLLEAHGAVSEPVAAALARGAAGRLGADCGVGITGIAGPGGGSPQKPVGLVWVAVAGPGGRVRTERGLIPGGREFVRTRACVIALHLLWRSMAD